MKKYQKVPRHSPGIVFATTFGIQYYVVDEFSILNIQAPSFELNNNKLKDDQIVTDVFCDD